MTDPGPCYAVKRVDFFGRSVKICLQNENGPCPLLAIANVLSLRNELKLPSGNPTISQSKLITMVADLLLERNKQLEHNADFQQNMADAFEVLQKLTTGIDVNVKFHSVFAFEPTKEVSVFDLLGIPLVHGWLVDPEDTTTSAVFLNKSYNELVELLLVNYEGPELERLPGSLTLRSSTSAASRGPSGALHDLVASPTHSLTDGAVAAAPAATLSSSSSSQQAAAAAGEGGQRQEAVAPGELPSPWVGPLSASTTSTAAEEGEPTEEAAIEQLLDDMLASMCNEEQPDRIELGESPTRTQIIKRKLAYNTPGPSRLQGQASTTTSSSGAAAAAAAAAAPDALAPAVAEGGADGGGLHPPGTPSAAAANHTAAGSHAAEAAAAAAPAAGARGTAAPAADSKGAAAAEVVRDFLEVHATQLTHYGVAQLVECLREHQLAVFFRNNHFNTLFKYEQQVFLLVTDQGYAHEPDIVWERLDSVAGDTSFFTGRFEPFVPHRDPSGGAFGQGGQYDTQYDAAVAASLAAADGGSGGDGGEPLLDTEDADFALALQLQLQEEEALRERDRIIAEQQGDGGQQQQQQQRQPQRQQPPPPGQQQQGQQPPQYAYQGQQRVMLSGEPGPSLQGAVLRQQQEKQRQQEQYGRGRGMAGRGRGRGGPGAKPLLDEAKEKCSIM